MQPRLLRSGKHRCRYRREHELGATEHDPVPLPRQVEEPIAGAAVNMGAAYVVVADEPRLEPPGERRAVGGVFVDDLSAPLDSDGDTRQHGRVDADER